MKHLLPYPDLLNGKEKILEMIQNGTPFDWDAILDLPMDGSTTPRMSKQSLCRKRKKSVTRDEDDKDFEVADSKEADFQEFP